MPGLVTIGVVSLVLHASLAGAFDPRAYPKSVATCKAPNRAEGKDVDIDIPLGQTMSTLIPPPRRLCFSFTAGRVSGVPGPTKLKNSGHVPSEYRLIVPDVRGFGSSTHPGDVRSSGTMDDIARDMFCVLDKAGVQSSICIGHDWGSSICFTGARMRPDIFTAVTGIAVPYLSGAGPFMPIRDYIPYFPGLAYQSFFNEHTTEAVAELAKDIRRTVRATLRDKASPPPEGFLKSDKTFLGAWDDVAEIPPVPFFTPNEEDYFVEQYEIQKFAYTLQYYTNENRELTWSYAKEQGNYTLPQPTLSLLPTADVVADWALLLQIVKSDDFLPKGKTEYMDGGHWCHIEFPETANKIIRAWLTETLETLEGQAAAQDEEQVVVDVHDEL
ncbi:Epoxide hydrolase [Mycena chlorophos]|uniref:Epoxide hydrolase n=1 Tax=Mycena chlorophos TaxID=658473 RepID=A0A8H6TM21_MYCCL|nr:Epoxide hydrolase [Mycena chlorophos]